VPHPVFELCVDGIIKNGEKQVVMITVGWKRGKKKTDQGERKSEGIMAHFFPLEVSRRRM